MPEAFEEFDRSRFVAREWEVLRVLAQHVCALNPNRFADLPVCGAVLMDLSTLEGGGRFELCHLRIVFVQRSRPIRSVEERYGLDWVSSFMWLVSEDQIGASATDLSA